MMFRRKTILGWLLLSSVSLIACAQPPDVEPREVLKVFSLRYIRATEAASMLRSLFDANRISIAADERTNALIVKGNDLVLQEIELLVERIDMAPKADLATTDRTSAKNGKPPEGSLSDYHRTLDSILKSNSSAQAVADPQQTIDSIRQQLTEVDRQAIRMATSLRTLADSKEQAGRSAPQHEELRKQVGKVFELRQKLQRAELYQFLQRLLETAQRIEMREGFAAEIIERRMHELLASDSLPTSELPLTESRRNLGESSTTAMTSAASQTSNLGGRRSTLSTALNIRLLNRPGSLEWINGVGGATTGQSGTTLNVPEGKRSEFRMRAIPEHSDLRLFASIEVLELADRAKQIVSGNKAELLFSEEDFVRLQKGLLVTKTFWVPNDLTEAGDNLIMVSESAAEVAQRGTVVATLNIATDAKKVAGPNSNPLPEN